jgi:hypothetical protein
VDEILKTALGCTVTGEEHKRRTQVDQVCDGWAKIAVRNTETGELEVRPD